MSARVTASDRFWRSPSVRMADTSSDNMNLGNLAFEYNVEHTVQQGQALTEEISRRMNLVQQERALSLEVFPCAPETNSIILNVIYVNGEVWESKNHGDLHLTVPPPMHSFQSRPAHPAHPAHPATGSGEQFATRCRSSVRLCSTEEVVSRLDDMARGVEQTPPPSPILSPVSNINAPDVPNDSHWAINDHVVGAPRPQTVNSRATAAAVTEASTEASTEACDGAVVDGAAVDGAEGTDVHWADDVEGRPFFTSRMPTIDPMETSPSVLCDLEEVPEQSERDGPNSPNHGQDWNDWNDWNGGARGARGARGIAKMAPWSFREDQLLLRLVKRTAKKNRWSHMAKWCEPFASNPVCNIPAQNCLPVDPLLLTLCAVGVFCSFASFICASIASWLSNRTPSMCRNRYHRIKVGSTRNDHTKLKNRCRHCGQIKRGHSCRARGRVFVVGSSEVGNGI